MNGSPVAALVRAWVDLYTRGMPAEARASRRYEIDDDLWCEHEAAAAAGRSPRSLDADLVLRLLFGVPSDITWRLAYRNDRTHASLETISMTKIESLGRLSVVAALCFGILLILFIPFSHALWTGQLGLFGMAVTLVGVIAFMAAGLGLAGRFQDRLGLLAGLGAPVMALGALISMVGSVVPLIVGSTLLMWDLARIGVVSRIVPIIHMATAILVVIGLAVGLGTDEPWSRALFGALLAPYLVTWFATGISLIRGVPLAEAPSA